MNPEWLYLACQMLGVEALPTELHNMLDEADQRIRRAKPTGCLRSTQVIAGIIALYEFKHNTKVGS